MQLRLLTKHRLLMECPLIGFSDLIDSFAAPIVFCRVEQLSTLKPPLAHTRGLECLPGKSEAEQDDKGRRGYGQPASYPFSFALEPHHRLSRINHQHADSDQNCGQARAKGNDQEKPEAYTVHRHGAQENNQRSGARHDAAADSQGQKLAQRRLVLHFMVGVRGAMTVCVATMLMIAFVTVPVPVMMRVFVPVIMVVV